MVEPFDGLKSDEHLRNLLKLLTDRLKRSGSDFKLKSILDN